MPTVENKVDISQHNSDDIILTYPPPTWSRILYSQKIFIPSCKQYNIDSLFQTTQSPYLGRLQMPSQVSGNTLKKLGMWWKILYILRRAAFNSINLWWIAALSAFTSFCPSRWPLALAHWLTWTVQCASTAVWSGHIC